MSPRSIYELFQCKKFLILRPFSIKLGNERQKKRRQTNEPQTTKKILRNERTKPRATHCELFFCNPPFRENINKTQRELIRHVYRS